MRPKHQRAALNDKKTLDPHNEIQEGGGEKIRGSRIEKTSTGVGGAKVGGLVNGPGTKQRKKRRRMGERKGRKEKL